MINNLKMNRHFISLLTLTFALIFSCSSPSGKKGDTPPIIDTLTAKATTSPNSDSLRIVQFMLDNKLNVVDTFLVGDVDGDGRKDQAMIQPMTLVWKNNKLDSQYIKINFSCNIPAIIHHHGFGGLIANVGDLDGNKTEELIYLPSWFQSNWTSIYIYGYRRNKWAEFARGSYYCGSESEGEDPIKHLRSRVKKINNRSFKLLESTTDADTGEFVDSTTIVYLK